MDNLLHIAARQHPELHMIEELAVSCGGRAYLVGGAVRDLLLGRTVRDLDFAVTQGGGELPERFAADCHGTFFWLDRQRGHARVVMKRGDGQTTFDFAPMRGATIQDDLACRDFTINAMGIGLAGSGELIDPCHGEEDLVAGIVRVAYPAAFEDDPLRMLRAFRLAATLGFAVAAETGDLIRRSASLLHATAAERIRDEFFQILAAPDTGSSLHSLYASGLLGSILPRQTAEWVSQTIAPRLQAIDRIEQTVTRFVQEMLAATDFITAELGLEVEGGISARALLKLAAFLEGEDAVSRTTELASRLRLGTKASRLLAGLLTGRERLLALRSLPLTERVMFRFFRDNGAAALPLLILFGSSPPDLTSLVRPLVEYFRSGYRPEAPDLLLTGDEVMERFGIPSGRELGAALEQLRAAEAVGLVSTAAEALIFMEKNLLTSKPPIS